MIQLETTRHVSASPFNGLTHISADNSAYHIRLTRNNHLLAGSKLKKRPLSPLQTLLYGSNL
jgi:hypothetical protein